MIETHHTSNEESSLHIEGYKCFSVCRPKRKKASGGLAAYVDTRIRAGVARVPLPGTESIVLKLKKDFFGFERDVFVCFAYCLPYNSPVINSGSLPSNVFEDLEGKLAQFSGLGDTILLGDMNSRTLCLPDFIPDDDSQHVPVPPPELYDSQLSGTEPRFNQDPGYNNYGPKFLELCKKVNLRILNGRFFGDWIGNLTCFTGRGSSTVDYGAVSPGLLTKIRCFQVGTIMPIFSDHCPIMIKIKVNAKFSLENKNYNFVPKPDKISWDKTKRDKFCEILNSNAAKIKIETFFKNEILLEPTSIEKAVSFITDVLIDTSTLAGMMLKKGLKPRKPGFNNRFVKVKPPKWHDKTCHEMYQSVQKTSLLLSKDPRNAWLRGTLRAETKQYNKILKFKQKEFIDTAFSDLDKMHSTDPKAYMDLVKALRNGSHDASKPSDTDSVDPEEWEDHFKNLLGKTKELSQNEIEMENYVKNNCDSLVSELDEPFSKEELKKVISCLKNNKSASFDLVTNEMLKASFPVLSEQLLALFNAILISNHFPEVWKNDILGPIHKSGGKDDPGNLGG